MLEENKDKIENLKKEKNKYIDKIFYLMLGVVVIFLAPVLLMVFLGKKIDNHFETGKKITFVLMFISFVFSWFIVLFLNKKLKNKIKKLADQIKENK